MMESLTGIDIDGDGKADTANGLPTFDPGAHWMYKNAQCVRKNADADIVMICCRDA